MANRPQSARITSYLAKQRDHDSLPPVSSRAHNAEENSLTLMFREQTESIAQLRRDHAETVQILRAQVAFESACARFTCFLISHFAVS